VCLRTCYKIGSDDENAEITQKVAAEYLVSGFESDMIRLLDVVNLYSFDHWPEVLDIIPEIAGTNPYALREHARSRIEFRSELQQEVNELRFSEVRSLKSNGDAMVKGIYSRYHHRLLQNYIIPIDEEAIDTHCPRLIYLDFFRRVLRSIRVHIELISGIVGSLSDGYHVDMKICG
jgi:hypothetical protein